MIKTAMQAYFFLSF